MTYAPDPTYMDPGLGWTEQNKHRGGVTAAQPAAEPEPAEVREEAPEKPRAPRRKNAASRRRS